MGASAFILFALAVLFAGLTAANVCIVGAVVFGVLKKEGKRFAKPLFIISIILTVLITILSMLPTAFLGLILLSNTVPPSDFVTTDTPIEILDEYYDSFLADGEVYVKTDGLTHHFEVCQSNWTPVFHYMPDEVMERHTAFNCYDIENDTGCTLIYASHSLYCKENELDDVLDYYERLDGFTYYHDTTWLDQETYEEHGEYYRLPNEVESALNEMLMHNAGSFYIGTSEIAEQDIDSRVEYIYITAASADGLTIKEYHDFIMIDGRVYLERSGTATDTGIIFTYRELPEDVESVLNGYFQAYYEQN